MSWWVIAALAAGTFAFRAAGPLVRSRVHVPPRVVRGLALAATALLVALGVTQTVYDGSSFAGWARVAGVLVAAVLVWRRAPFVLVVVGAAASAAILRALGVA
ncbi:AzlD domain-containing protein [Rhodococcus rhodnii]|uniref:Branched-chain amino acid transporter n=2 Tax=Rhodococcus rhodnii TaxID=38312 RepID=R7WKN4_9NOCA|nr:AzlD domain-containing protein [Rhodococcus rhodnii]EOM75871.1 hypothetical protein Rrhod_2783 [Rhodococcus rhodnii LMG 5362]TXG91040.1 AzlD domain-containing protein [Rhodococcus rhodnii]